MGSSRLCVDVIIVCVGAECLCELLDQLNKSAMWVSECVCAFIDS